MFFDVGFYYKRIHCLCAFSFFLALCQPIFLFLLSRRHLFTPLSLCPFYTFRHPLFFTPSITSTPFLCPVTCPFYTFRHLFFLRPVSRRHPFYTPITCPFYTPPHFFYAQYHINTPFIPLSLCSFYTFRHLFFTSSITPTPLLCTSHVEFNLKDSL